MLTCAALQQQVDLNRNTVMTAAHVEAWQQQRGHNQQQARVETMTEAQ